MIDQLVCCVFLEVLEVVVSRWLAEVGDSIEGERVLEMAVSRMLAFFCSLIVTKSRRLLLRLYTLYPIGLSNSNSNPSISNE